MSERDASSGQDTGPEYYEIRIQGHLDARRWANWFEGMSITLEENGATLLAGWVVDQATLYGLLRKVRDLGMPLLSVRRNETHHHVGSDRESNHE